MKRSVADVETMITRGQLIDGKTLGAFTLWKHGASGSGAAPMGSPELNS
ncbi:MAG: hypothetical protein NT059_07805 [Planctomycetota bacterium]|nr:hypothetical protein [Planctomycetota bacterium]